MSERCDGPRHGAPGDQRLTTLIPPDVDVLNTHLTAEFLGVPAEQLRDAALLSRLLIAAASTSGLSPSGVPVVKEHPSGNVSAMLLLDGAHLTLHSFPAQQTLLFDLLAPASHDFRKVVEVFARRLTAREIRNDTRGRG